MEEKVLNKDIVTLKMEEKVLNKDIVTLKILLLFHLEEKVS